MTAIDHQWLAQKRAELKEAYQIHGNVVRMWDIQSFLTIIDDQAREIRRLKTEALRK